MPPKRNTKAEKPATDSPEKNNNNKNKNNNDKSPQPASTDDRPAEEPNDNSADTSSNPEQKEPTGEETKETTTEPAEDDNAAKARQRQERFKALQARAKNATKRNLKETAAETQRLATDPGVMSSLSRKHAFASHNLLRADTEASGEDFERKRAWDWTVDESERWDKRVEKKQRRRDDVAFQDYTQDARKVYKRQMRELQPDYEAYEREKLAAIEKAASNGDLEIVETDNGEMVALDRNGSFYSTADTVGFTENKPNRAAVDRLVGDLQKAEEVRLKKRRERRGEEEPDVTFINEKNKQFNQKLSRFYNKYTTEIRDSFERGTMI